MATIEDLFTLHTARSSGFKSYKEGKVAFVTNGFRENGVLGFVEPKALDRVFRFLGIALSAFCEATVQPPPFIARGNGGSGLIVLEPLKPMTANQLGYVAAFINQSSRWRFNWYRQASVDRVRRLIVPDPTNPPVGYDVRALLPKSLDMRKAAWRANFTQFRLDTIYEMVPGDYHVASTLPQGDIPLVACGDRDNGIIRFVDVPAKHAYSCKLTVAFNGSPLTTNYHPYKFATKDDVAVCHSRRPLRLSTELFIQTMMNRERWRYSYYRKCYLDKLKRLGILLPAKDGELDEDAMQAAMESAPYWNFLQARLAATVAF